MLTKSIILIGMPGSGKSTVGKVLAKRLGVEFCDTDRLITSSTGERLQDTLDKRGREGFLDKERRELLSLNPDTPIVIATGGSVVLHSDAMQHLKDIGLIVFLDADLPLLRKRLSNISSRGIVFSDNGEDILGVFRERELLYYKYSDIRIHIRGKRPDDIVNAICKQVI